MAIGIVSASKKQSIGFCDEIGGFSSYTHPTTGNYALTGSPSSRGLIAFSDDATTNRTFGTVQNILDGSFEIDWSKTGTGATGTAYIGLLIQYHG